MHDNRPDKRFDRTASDKIVADLASINPDFASLKARADAAQMSIVFVKTGKMAYIWDSMGKAVGWFRIGDIPRAHHLITDHTHSDLHY